MNAKSSALLDATENNMAHKATRSNTPHGTDSIQALVYGISHDLGAPLRSVVQFSQLLEDKLDQRLSEKERYWLQLIHQNGVKGQNMVCALLNYSRLTTHHHQETTIQLTPLIESIIKESLINVPKKSQISDQIKQANCKITSQLPDLTGFRDHWYLFFRCIIENSLTFQPLNDPNHIPLVNIRGQENNQSIVIQVDDNGIGVSEDYVGRITRAFMRLNPEKYYAGLGMGLAYCERIAQIHGGILTFKTSDLGGLSVIYTFHKPVDQDF